MSIQIQGLSRRQRAIADVLWMMPTREDAERFMASLNPATRRDADLVVELLQLAITDECDTIDPDVAELIDNLR